MDQTSDSQNFHSPSELPEYSNAEDGSGEDAASLYHDVGATPASDGDLDYDDEPDEHDGGSELYEPLDGEIPFDLVVEEDENDEGEYEDEYEDEDDDDDDDIDGVVAMPRLTYLFGESAERRGLLTSAQGRVLVMRDGEVSEVTFGNNSGGETLFNNFGIERRLHVKDPDRFPKVPSEEGVKLMRTGTFGANDYDNVHDRKRVARRMLERELGIGSIGERKRNNELVTQALIPGTRAEKIIHYDDPVYSGQFSDDGNFFFSCCQDFRVRMYDTSNPYNWKHYKTVSYPWGQWTLTDASLSPDNRWLAYTSIQSMVSIAPTDPRDTGDPYTLELDDGAGHAAQRGWRTRGGFGIWSIRFSGDGRELVAGTSSNSLVVYDIESRRVLHHIEGHEDHVNAVCFADKSSPHIIYSGSDDATLKVWDRRSLGDGREAGAFVGHVEGLTYIDSKGDGRYILSNGKDQSMKLWDLRKVMSANQFRSFRQSLYANTSGFDYRREAYDDADWDVHPHDNSVVTFRGHRVLRTLIRCHFSPPSATNSRYVYSGSGDGKVYIWNMDATLAGTIDVKKATMGTRRIDRQRRLYFEPFAGWGTCVRDASWHPSAPIIVASAWNGYSMARGTCTLHAFNEGPDDEGEPRMRRSVDALLRPNPEEFNESGF